MIGYVKIRFTDVPAAMLPGGQAELVVAGDPVPDGMMISEVITTKDWQLTTGEDTYSRRRAVQKVAYMRYRLKIFARPSDNVDLLQFANRFEVELPSGDIHIAELIEYMPTPAAGTAVRQIDIIYVDTNSDNYPVEPVNEWLTHDSLQAKIAAGTLNAIKCARLRFVYDSVTYQWYTILKPEPYFSEPKYPDDDSVAGLMKPNATQSTERIRLVFYANTVTKNIITGKLILYGATDTAVTTLFYPGTPQNVKAAIERPIVSAEQIEGARDLWLITVDFATVNHYTYNYND